MRYLLLAALATPLAVTSVLAQAPQKISLAAGLQRSYAAIKMNLTEMATKMPEADYTFAPTKEVRTFGQLLRHVAKALADSFAYCDPAFAALTDAGAVEYVRQGPNEVARGSVLAGLIAHSNEIYGTAVPYMRMKGLVPPSTERQQQMRRPQ